MTTTTGDEERTDRRYERTNDVCGCGCVDVWWIWGECGWIYLVNQGTCVYQSSTGKARQEFYFFLFFGCVVV